MSLYSYHLRSRRYLLAHSGAVGWASFQDRLPGVSAKPISRSQRDSSSPNADPSLSSAWLRPIVLIVFHKPYGVVCQFTQETASARTLAEFNFPPRVYSLGRLDADSEGLLLLSDEAGLNHQLLHPRAGHRRRYWAQVERVPGEEALERLRSGLRIGEHATSPCRVWVLSPQPDLPPREPPIRFRLSVPTAWMALELVEGKNRQVRRMTAAVGHPTLRLIRVQIGDFILGDLPAGTWKTLSPAERRLVFA